MFGNMFGENLFDDFFDGFGHLMYKRPQIESAENGVTATDVREKDNSFIIDMNLPGYKKENISARLKDGYLTITASKGGEKEEKGAKFLRRERYYGSCTRSFFVGEHLKEEDIKAKFENGVLSLEVPKEEAVKEIEKPKFIAIE